VTKGWLKVSINTIVHRPFLFAVALAFLWTNLATASTHYDPNTTSNAATALRRYTALRKQAGGQVVVHYDYIEDNQLKGGRTTITLPPATLDDMQELTGLWNVTTLIDNGPISNRIDLVFIGDGYTSSEMTTYSTHLLNVLTLFMAEEPFAAYFNYFNVHQVDVISNESGVDEPDNGIYRDTALDMTYNCSGIPRFLCINYSKAVAAATEAPDVDQILALANSTRYGGFGVGGFTTFAGNNSSAAELALHEFGHAFPDLGDEYDYDDGSTYTGPEPGKANISIYTAPDQLNLETKWFRWLDESNVDTFEGAYYKQYGIYRPTFSSKMRNLGYPFEQVNVEQFVIEIYKVVSPIDDATPVSPIPLPYDTTFYVTPMQPMDHNLDIQWSLNSIDISGANSLTYTPDYSSLPAGIHNVAVTVIDNTSRVRDENVIASYLTASRQWQIETFLETDFDENGIINFRDFVILASQWLLEKLSADVSPAGGDGFVDLSDWAVFADAWQSTSEPPSANWNPKCDIAPDGGNGIVDMNDLSVFVNQWLQFGAHCADIAPDGGDGIVDWLDLKALLDDWLLCTGTGCI
jgi:hypothetical protein